MVKEIKIEFVDKAVSSWGGMKLMKDLMEQTGIKEFLSALDLPQPGSNRGYSPEQIIECFWVSIWAGAGRFSHSAMLRYDGVLREIFGWKQAPSQSTYSRFFRKFSWKRNTEVFVPLQRWMLNQMRWDNLTLDLDSSVITRYGEQEGSRRGYNPQKPGRHSHHPLIAFIPQLRMVANAWLRPGDTVALSNSKHFLNETIEILSDKKIGLVRADSGFYAHDFLRYFEERKLNYIVAVKMFSSIKNELRGLKNWIPYKDGIQICEFIYQSPEWKTPRRMVAVRKNIRILPKSTGQMLLFNDQIETYRYSVYVTNLELPAEQVWNLYKERGDAENRIKELKYDFGLDSFCMNKFWATEAAFRFIMVAYNLMSMFRLLVLRTKSQATLSTLRFKCFALGSWISKHAGKTTLKLSTSGHKRRWLEGLFSKVGDISPPFFFSNA